MSLRKQFDYYGLTVHSCMIDIRFLDIFVKHSVLQFYLTANYCPRYANHSSGLRGFKKKSDTITSSGILRLPGEVAVTAILILITLTERVLSAKCCRKFLSFMFL